MNDSLIEKFRKIIFILTPVLLFPFINYSQTSIVDSLQQIVITQNNDSNKVKSLLLLAWELDDSKHKDIFQYNKLALDLSKKINYQKGIIDSWYQLGVFYSKFKNNEDSALFYCKKVIDISDSINYIQKLADGYRISGIALTGKGYYSSALEYLKKSIFLYNQLFDTLSIAKANNSIGIIHFKHAHYDSAIIYYMNSNRYYNAVGKKKFTAYNLINIAKCHIKLEEFEKAKEILLESLSVNKKYNNSINIGITYVNLGIISKEENNPDEALNYYDKALNIYRDIGYKSGIGHIYVNMGNAYKDKGQYPTALNYMENSIKIFKEISNRDGILGSLTNLAVIYVRIKKYSEALSIYDTCKILAKELGDRGNLLTIYDNIYGIYYSSGDYKNALKYKTKYVDLKDSIFNLDQSKIIADLELRYEKEKDQAHIFELQNENLQKNLDLRKKTNQRNIYFASGTSIIVIGILLFIFYRQKVIKDRIISDQKIRQLEEEKKLLAAKAIVEGQEEERKRIALELHDGIGVLLSTAKIHFANISEKTPKNKESIDKASKLLEQISGDVRKISHNMMPGVLTKLGLNDAMEDLFEDIDEMSNISAHINISGDEIRVPENTEIMLYRIFQEIINNTLKHAGAKTLSLNMNYLPEKLHIQFADDGIGFNVEEKLTSKSLGLSSIQSRVDFLGGDLIIESLQGKGTTYFIQIPIKKS
ncbi:MAG: sensor histidine kinase [Bacteroidales bacterium]|nr:sensor histidine kinase [Bacteroidales bacterium]